MTVDLFEALVRRPPWMADALCREYPGVTWFPERGEHAGITAKSVCAACLVHADCLGWALRQPDTLAGIWAGTSSRDRRMLRPAPAA